MTHAPVRTRLLLWLRVHRLRLLILFAGVLIPLWIFGLLAEDVVDREQFFFDAPILVFMHSRATPTLDTIMLFFSLVGYRFGVVPIDLLVLLLLVVRRRWGDVLFWSLAVGGAAILNLAAKRSFGRIRPDLWLSIAPETTFSFPSGHAMAAASIYATIAIVIGRLAPAARPTLMFAAPILIFAIGLSRIYLGAHWVTDVLAGFAAGAALTLLGTLWLCRATPASVSSAASAVPAATRDQMLKVESLEKRESS